MPTQDSYPVLSVADDNTYATGYRVDPVSGKLTTMRVPMPFLYGGKWSMGVGAPTVNGVGTGDSYLNVQNGDVYSWNETTLSWGTPVGTLINGTYQIPIWVMGKPLPGEILYSLEAPSIFVLNAGMTDSVAGADTAATASSVFNLVRISGGVSTTIGTITYAAGATVGTIACPSQVIFNVGDILNVVAPASADATLSNIRMTLVASRPSGAAESDIVSSGQAAASAAAAAASAAAASASATTAGASATTAQNWASQSSGTVDGTSYSAKYYANSISGSAATATTQASNAAASAVLAQAWASQTSGVVNGTAYFSAYYYSQQAASSASGAAGSATAAAGSATTASTQAGNAASSATAAAGSASSAASSLATLTSTLSGRNRIINGACLVAQYAAASFGPGASGYAGPDQWKTANVGTGGTFTQAQGSFTVNGRSLFCVTQTITTAATNLTGTNYMHGIFQPIEGFHCADLLGQPVTVSFWAYATVAGQYSVSLNDNGGNHSYLTTITLAANTPQYCVIPVPPIPTSANIPFSTALGLNLTIGALNTGTYQAAASTAWQAGNYVAATGNVNWAATVGNQLSVTQVQLEAGTVATPFEFEHISDVLEKCQRYYETGAAFFQGPVSGGVNGGTIPYKVPKRVAPTAVASNITYSSASSLTMNANGFADDANGFAYNYISTAAAGWISFNWTASAVL